MACPIMIAMECYSRRSACIYCLICYSFESRWHAYAKSGGRESPGMRVTFFRVAERKSPKKGRPCCLRPLRFATGQPGVLVHGVHRRTRCAPAALRSNNCGESVHEARVSFGTRATPRPARPRRIQKGTRGADSHTGHCFAALRSAPSRGRKRHALRRRGRAQRWPEWMLAVRLSHPCWLRLRRGGCGVARASERACFVN